MVLSVALTVSAFPVHTALVDRPVHHDPEVRSDPVVRIDTRGATPKQLDYLSDALARFDEANLRLPDLQVVFSDDDADCNGGFGLFSTGSDPWKVTICNRHISDVYLHELAHAWTCEHLDDNAIQRFLEAHGLDNWNDRSKEWRSRGFEVAAVEIGAWLGGYSETSDKPAVLDVDPLTVGRRLS